MPKPKSSAEAAPEPLSHLATAPWRVGTAYLIRTVTYHVVGRLVWVGPLELVLEDAAWVADSGRWNAALQSGQLSEVEPFPARVIVGRGSITDATEWTHLLPLAVK